MSRDQGTDHNSHIRRIVSFYGLALLWPLVAGIVLSQLGTSVSPVISTLLLALVMPAPLIAALIVGRDQERESIRSMVARAFRRPVRLLVPPAVAIVVWFLVCLGLVWLVGDVMGVEGVGSVSRTTTEIEESAAEQLGNAAGDVQLPNAAALIGVALLGGLAAGYTINGLLAFGEEYGWRGYLTDLLASRGRAAPIGVVGVLWGLWHAPLILLAGFNFPEQRWMGVVAMTLFAVAMSWPLEQLRRITDTPMGPAIAHGMLNGTAGVLILVLGGDRLLAPPLGLLGAAAWIPVALVIQLLWTRSRLGNDQAQGPWP